MRPRSRRKMTARPASWRRRLSGRNRLCSPWHKDSTNLCARIHATPWLTCQHESRSLKFLSSMRTKALAASRSLCGKMRTVSGVLLLLCHAYVWVDQLATHMVTNTCGRHILFLHASRVARRAAQRAKGLTVAPASLSLGAVTSSPPPLNPCSLSPLHACT